MTRQPFPYNDPVSSRYGAPMGRPNESGDYDHTGRLTLRRVPMIDGDYDGGGAYWGGGGTPLYCAWSPDRSIVVYLRANGYRAAVASLREDYESAVIVANGETYQPERAALPVIFRAVKSGQFKGDVEAFFPTLPGTRAPWTATVYAHVGQHSTTDKGYYSAMTRAATPAEYAPLLRELRGIYEEGADAVRLDIVQRWTAKHDAARRAALKESGR